MNENKQKSYLSIKIEMSKVERILFKCRPESDTNHPNVAHNQHEEYNVVISFQYLFNDPEIVGSVCGSPGSVDAKEHLYSSLLH